MAKEGFGISLDVLNSFLLPIVELNVNGFLDVIGNKSQLLLETSDMVGIWVSKAF